MSVEMKNLVIKGTNFEVVDNKARNDIIGLKGDLDVMLDEEHTKNLFDKNAITDNVLIDGTTGKEVVSDRYFTSDFILVPKGGWTISAKSKMEHFALCLR